MKAAMPLVMTRSASESASRTVPFIDLLLTWPNVNADRCSATSPGSSAPSRPEAARGYAAPPGSGPRAGPAGGTRSARPVTFSGRPGDGTATGQLASAQTVRPG